MTTYFITGTTSGLGHALVACLLNDENNGEENHVYAINRRPDSRLPTIHLDLSRIEDVKDFEFDGDVPAPGKVVLVNNAGWIGPIDEVGRQDPQDIVDLFNINTISPCILTNKFIARFADLHEVVVVNVSGASWGVSDLELMGLYSASKAALTRFTAVAAAERKSILGILPGGLDSAMQAGIRSQESGVRQMHVDLKESGCLRDPSIVAECLIKIVRNPENYNALVNIPEAFGL